MTKLCCEHSFPWISMLEQLSAAWQHCQRTTVVHFSGMLLTFIVGLASLFVALGRPWIPSCPLFAGA